MVKCIPVLPLFSKKGLRLACKIVEVRASDQRTVERLLRELVEPLLDHINFATGLDNDANYVAWRLLHALRKE